MFHIRLGIEASSNKNFTCTENDPNHVVNFEEVRSTYEYNEYNVTLYWVFSNGDSTAECIIDMKAVDITNCSSNHKNCKHAYKLF